VLHNYRHERLANDKYSNLLVQLVSHEEEVFWIPSLIRHILLQIKAMIKFTIHSGEFGEPEDIGEAAAFLLSKRAKFISGTTLSVNGAQYN